MNKAPKLADREINAQITFIDFGAHGFAQPPGQLDHILMVGAQIGQRYTAVPRLKSPVSQLNCSASSSCKSSKVTLVLPPLTGRFSLMIQGRTAFVKQKLNKNHPNL